jgi:hypothetical protein
MARRTKNQKSKIKNQKRFFIVYFLQPQGLHAYVAITLVGIQGTHFLGLG